MYSAVQQGKAQLKAEKESLAINSQLRTIETNRETEATLQNIAATKRQETSDLMNIELAALRAEDEALVARSGSGLSGGSLDDLDAEILIDVNKDKVNAQRQASQNVDALTTNLRYSNENRKVESSQTRRRTDTTGLIKNALFSTTGQALSSMK